MKTVSAILVCATLLTACLPAPESARGFRLPDGDADRGLAALTDLQCHACHSVEGLDLQYLGTGAADVKLGGTVARVKTYGELVTSIINPSHKLAPGYQRDEVSIDGESLMTLASVNDVMTVQQLIDLVAFLQARYEVVPPQYDPYGYVYP
jgi:mono/diheme cytochrome c family protein